MKKLPVVLDLETKEKFSQVGNDRKKLGISVVGIFDYKTGKTKTFLETELNGLFKILENSSYVVGFNIRTFDIPILQTYYPGKISHFPIFDILDDIKGKIGKRLGLNDVAFATLDKRKTGHGLLAIELYKEGKIDELRRYCLDDVILTKELFDFGVKNAKIFYLNSKGKAEIAVDWKKYLVSSKGKDTHLTLPF